MSSTTHIMPVPKLRYHHTASEEVFLCGLESGIGHQTTEFPLRWDYVDTYLDGKCTERVVCSKCVAAITPLLILKYTDL